MFWDKIFESRKKVKPEYREKVKPVRFHPAELEGDNAFYAGRYPCGMYEIAILNYLIELTTPPIPNAFLSDRESMQRRKRREEIELRHEEGLEGVLRVIGKIEDYAQRIGGNNLAGDLYIKATTYRAMVDGLSRIRGDCIEGIESIRYSLGISTESLRLDEFRAQLLVLYQRALNEQR